MTGNVRRCLKCGLASGGKGLLSECSGLASSGGRMGVVRTPERAHVNLYAFPDT